MIIVESGDRQIGTCTSIKYSNDGTALEIKKAEQIYLMNFDRCKI